MSNPGTGMEELVRRAVNAGWQSRPAKSGWMVTSPRGDTARIPARGNNGRAGINAERNLVKLGLEVDEDRVAAAVETERQRKLGIGQTSKVNGHQHRSGQTLTDGGNPAVPVATFRTAEEGHAQDDVEPVLVAAVDGVPEMFTRTEEITPERAFALLSRDLPMRENGKRVQQRRLDPAHIKWLAGIMTDKKWVLSPDGIVLAPEEPVNSGGCLNGQHRLNAVIESGETIPMRVTYNCPPEVFETFDSGKKRTAADVLIASGESNAFHLSSALKLSFCWLQYNNDPEGPFSDWRNWNRMKPSNAQLNGMLADGPGLLQGHGEIREFIRPATSMMANSKIGGIVAAGAVGMYGATLADPGCWVVEPDPQREGKTITSGKLHDFCTAVATGAMIGPGHPAYTLRQWMMGPAGGGPKNVMRREAQLFAWILAWNAYSAGRDLKAIRIHYGNVSNPTPAPMPALYVPRQR